MPINHVKTNQIPNWTQADLDAQIAAGNFPPGTVLADIVLPSDWNDDHTNPDIADVTGLQAALDAKQGDLTLTTIGTSGAATLIGDTLNIPNYADTDTGITQLTGDVTAGPGNGAQAATLATVNANVGSFGSGTQVMTQTVNAKGLTTAAGNVAIAIPSTQVTDFTEAAQDAVGAMVNTSLTYVDGTPSLGLTSRTINGTAFDGTANITVTAAAGTLTGGTLAAGVTASSLTSVGTIATGVWQGTPIADSYIASAATWNAKQNAITFGTGVQTALGVNIGSAGAPVLFNGALGTPSSGVATNLTGTAAGLTAGTVTTNANLTGEVTSVGNATTLTNSAVIGKVLTGYTSGAGTVAATDTILQAVQKLNGNDGLKANIAGQVFTGAISATNLSGTNTGDQTTITGNAGSATILQTGRTIAITGDLAYTSPSFNGSGNVTAAGTLATVNANVGSFGSATQSAVPTVNAKGLITAISNTTITPAVSSITGLGTGVATALAVNVGSAGAPVVNGGALGTPSSGVATNLTGTAAGLTAGNVTTNANLTGAITSTGNATSLGSFSSANLRTALTDENGTGAALFDGATSPTFVTPILGVAAATSINFGQDPLNYYDAGTFTPVLIGTTTAGVGTYTAQVGRYTRIGNMVYYRINLTWTAHTGTGNMQITGLPFGASAGGFAIPASVLTQNMTSPASTVVRVAVLAGAATMAIYSQTVATGVLAALAMDTNAELYISGAYDV